MPSGWSTNSPPAPPQRRCRPPTGSARRRRRPRAALLFVDNRGITDARVNLALEEYVFRHKPAAEDVLLFYVNAPAIIIGRNQNTIEEIDPGVVAARGIHVVRRVSGGGAVYHDLGNLNFSFMTAQVTDRFARYDHFTRPVIDVLRDLGVPAELGGRNDILADGRKISGNAQFATPTRMFSHGTLLLDSDLDAVTAALRPRPGKVESKGVKSIRSRVANIREFLREPIDVDELRERILERIFGTRHRDRIPTVELTAEDWSAVDALVASKYGTWAWNYGENPPSNVQRAQRFAAGEIDVRLDVREGRIATARIFGDFMGRESVDALEARLVGVPYDRPAIEAALADVDVTAYFGAVTREEVLGLVGP
ncbi:MAG TPA: lipoate--protein ligase [Gemmatimonadaceae bacterium]|nr:lipoate--protein ligase [Gemmatimonadaceae bacterium]